jgi:GMP synthase-like glutamine amidotransferase
VHIINYKNWKKRKVAIFSADSSVRSNVKGVLELLEVPAIIFCPDDEDLVERWKKHKKEIYGIIITGSRFDIGETLAPIIPIEMINSGLPILGLCYGHEYLLSILGVKMIECMPPIGEQGSVIVNIDSTNPIFKGLPANRCIVNMNHSWMANPNDMPSDIQVIAFSKMTPIAGFYYPKKKWWGVQFHPERDFMHNTIFKNFVNLCYERL